MFSTNNFSGSVIVFMGGSPLAGRPWVFNIPRDNPWLWLEVEYVDNAIEMQGGLVQKGKKNTLWQAGARALG